jgi:hypothetical protein
VLFYGIYDRRPDAPQRVAEERAGEVIAQDPSALESKGVPEIEELLADGAARVPEQVQPIEDAPSGEPEAHESASEIAGAPAEPRPVPKEQPGSTQASEPQEMVLAMLMPEYTMPSGALSVSRAPVVYRKPESSNPELTALAPPHVARASGSSPTLPWHVNRIPEEGAFYLTILEEGGEPIVENRLLDQPAASGIQRISLARLGVSLPAGVELRWSVAHRLEEESPPTDYSFGWIEVVEAGSPEHDCVEGARLVDRPAACARLGYWYDAIEATLQLESRFPGDDQPQAALRLLLKQAELDGIEP